MNPRLLLGALMCALISPSPADLLAHWKLDSSTADEVASNPAGWSAAADYTTSTAAPLSTAAGNFANGAWLGAGTNFNFERYQAFSASAWIKGGPQDSAIVGDMVQSDDFQGWELHVGTDVNGANTQSVTVWLIHDYPSDALQVNASVPVLDDLWHHVAFTYDGSSTAAGLKIYIDGVDANATAGIDNLGGNIANGLLAPLNIGTRMNGAYHTFTGAIDEVAIFNNALAAGEIASIFSAGVESISFPYVADSVPLPGQSVTAMTSADVIFSFPVNGVDAGDFIINGSPATGLQVTDAKTYRFIFPTPPQGDVHFTWAADHGITGTNGITAQLQGWSSRFSPVLPAPQVAIAEFLTQNSGGLYDSDFDTPDWIELTNPGSADLNLAGYSLTDDPARPRRWVFPAVTLRPSERKIVYASGKNRALTTGQLHTDFKLSAGGGYLGLFDPAGNPVHIFDKYPRQEANVSFGLLAGGKPADGRAGWRYLTPTPAASPLGSIFSGAAIMETAFSPAVPAVGAPVNVTVRVSPDAVMSTQPQLRYRWAFGGETLLNFADDGLHGDGAAGDRLYGATIPTTGQPAGTLLRWRINLTSNGTVSQWPVNTSTANSLPVYEGTVIGGEPAGSALPVYQFFVQSYVFPTTTTQSGIDSDGGGRGAFFGKGKLYDNVLIRIKGTTSRNLFKRSHRVDFNPGRDFEWSDEYPPQRELNLNSEYNDPSYLRQNLQHWMHHDSGNAGAPHFPVSLVMNGMTWQLAFHTYSADSELTEVLGLNPRGALYKQVGTLNTSSTPEKKTRRWENNDDFVALRNGIASGASASSKTAYMFDNFNLPAVINYLAVTRIAQEADDVWANMVVYRDSDGTKEWRPIPFDLNLSFGQLFYNGESANTVIQATNDSNKSHPLYGSSSCLSNTGNIGQWNRLYDVVIQNSITRSMLLRRERSLIDRYLKEPGTLAIDSPLEARFDELGALIKPFGDVDRARWGWPTNSGAYGLGPNIYPAQGLATLKSSFLTPRRNHLYVTHSVNNTGKLIGITNSSSAGIPNAQSATPPVIFNSVLAHPTSGNQDQEYIELRNSSTDAVDVSDWVLRGASGSFKFAGGTVIPAVSSIYVSPNVVAFRARTTTPKANENRFVVGPYPGHLSRYGEILRLFDANEVQIAQTTVAPDPTAPPVSLAVTEIMSSSVHTDNTINGDWWELTNTGSDAVELAGFSWDDNRGQSGQAVFGNLTLAAGETAIILDEDDDDEAALFRSAWNLPSTQKILTRDDFGLDSLRGLGNGDSVIVYRPDGTEAARADYPAQLAGRSRMWFRNGVAVPGGYAAPGKYATLNSLASPSDLASPGFAAQDPSTFTQPYDIWAAANDLWTSAALPTADPDGDGRDNRSEYAFGGNPGIADVPPPPVIAPSSEEFEWSFVHRGDDPALVFTIQSSTDLVAWQNASLTLLGQVPHPEMPGYVIVTYRIIPEPGSAYFRAKLN
ncbi:lamin tail domain-containing protein [Haloferula sp. BvORR071]|uniref:lamin tail domain-containing protein n=1 Tax=Haloferula sp. BvORR071 TaxID=1396141 RepID=UPI0005528BB6|nr:lamin tail domain-containing protein [Haloferula sp. BvORR071]